MYTVKVLAVTIRSDSNAEILHITKAVVLAIAHNSLLFVNCILHLHLMHVISKSFAETKKPKL